MTTMKVEHSPSPWRWIEDASGQNHLYGADDHWIASEPIGDDARPEDRAVLQAASELFSVCEKYLAWHRRDYDRESVSVILDEMRAAVAKVRQVQ